MARSAQARDPDHRLRVFISSTLIELRDARAVARHAVEQLRLSPVLLDLGSRPHPAREQYAAYLQRSDIFIGIYWQSYGWIGFGAEISGVEDELRLAAGLPRLLYVREPAPDRDPRLEALLAELRAEAATSYKHFSDLAELEGLILDDLALLLTERFEVGPVAAPATSATARNVILEPVNPLIGREAELARARAWLASDDVRLVTLTGPGGVGKSRLALELAKLEEPRFADGVWTILLESVRDPGLVLATIARTLDLRTGGGKTPDEVLDAVRQRLAGQRTLLVLDNFEHVLPAARDLARLIESCEGLHVLVTSRSALRVRAERELPVAPLGVPSDPAEATIAALEGSAAVQLFLARAAAMRVDLSGDEAALRDVAEICRRLDGLPLAIELAAARVRLLPPRQLLSRLTERFGILTSGSADMPERHQTLQATIDWGYDLLEPEEQMALQALAVFSDGCTLPAAEAVLAAAGLECADVLDVLDGLVSKSFVIPPGGEGPSPRFRMLETIRQYATGRLRTGTLLEATVDAHAEHYLAYAEHAATNLQGPDQTTWFDSLEDDHANLIAALRRLEERGDEERVLRLTVALARLWFVHSHLKEATHWVGLCLDRTAGRRDRLRADLLTWAGWIVLFVRGDTDRAEAISREALELRREMGDRHGEAMETLALGNVATFRGDAAEAQRLYRDTAALAEAENDDEILGRAVANLGVVARARGDLAEARRSLERARTIMAARGDEHSVVLATTNLSGVALDAGELEEAIRLAQETLRRSTEAHDEFSVLEAMENLAAARAARGDVTAGAWLYGAAERMAESLSLVRSALEAPLYERHLERARSLAAGEGCSATFAAAWAAGRAARRTDAIAVALEEQPVPETA
jgi:predicted ATPase